MNPPRRRKSLRLGQVTTEVVILVGVVLMAVVVTTWKLPKAIKHHYEENRDVLASPM